MINLYLTGGGSGGHAIPLYTVYKELKKNQSLSKDNVEIPTYNLYLVGRAEGIEKELFKKEKTTFFTIRTGKLRRKITFRHLLDFFFFIVSIWRCFIFLHKTKVNKNIVFSTGGYVALPLVIAAALHKIPIVIHEQTTQIGLANQISSFFATKILLSFAKSQQFYPQQKTIVTGYPLREELFVARKNSNMQKLKNFFPIAKPLVLVTGGGNGSKLINDLILANKSQLLKKYNIFHQVGKVFYQQMKNQETKGYKVVDFISNDLWIALLYLADLIISRSGAGIVSECMALDKNCLFIPLAIAQKNEQYHNAKAAQNLSPQKIIVVEEKKLGEINWVKLLTTSLKKNKAVKKNNSLAKPTNPTKKIVREILSWCLINF